MTLNYRVRRLEMRRGLRHWRDIPDVENDAERMAALPLDVMQPVEIAAGLVAVVFLLIRLLPYLGY